MAIALLKSARIAGHFTRVCTGVPTYGEKETPFPQKEAVITVVESAISFTVVATVLQQLRSFPVSALRRPKGSKRSCALVSLFQ
mmetsp:Transcript_47329/g.109535  ORF Transcript_47329/g.109535 Transcript_47329/m.109535 type:complete len:84 (+) Transcript_47329:29-280(+)